MGTVTVGSRVCTDWLSYSYPLTPPPKMNSFIILTLAASALAAPQLPAGVSAAACPNYPYCDAATGFLAVPNVPGAGDVIRAQEALIRGFNGQAAVSQASRLMPPLRLLSSNRAVEVTLPMLLLRMLSFSSKAVFPLVSTRESLLTSRLRQLFVLLSRTSLLLVFSSRDKNKFGAGGFGDKLFR